MKDLFLSIFNIFKWAGKIFTIIRNTIFNLLLILLVALAISGFLATRTSDLPVIQENTGLVLSLAGNIVEEKEDVDPFNELFNEAMGGDNPYQEILLQDILDAIHSATVDPNISYLLLDLKHLGGAGLPQLASIGHALTEFKTSGKKVVAAEDFYSQRQYYLAAYANEIILNPMGGVDLHGFGVYRLYFKDMLDKLKVNYHIFRVGTHKSALEPVMRNSMSMEDREQNSKWLGALWNDFKQDISTERNISVDVIDNYTNNAPDNLLMVGGDTATLAMEKGLVDKLMTRIERSNYLATLSGKSFDGKPRVIGINDYLATIEPSYTGDDASIGLIIATGTILPGEQPPGTIGGDSLAEIIRSARLDKDIKAVVLRIDSGGGSAFASEIIRQEILALKESGKKIVVSMGSVAASGGYWIAADANEIWASPTTITGSIGIFGAIPTFEDSLSELGVYGDGVGTTRISSGINVTQPLSKDLSQVIQLSVEYGYQQFLSIVSEGRNIDMQQVQQLANGKVYDGIEAKQLGLVDQLGGLEEAIDSAAQLANLSSDYTIRYVKQPLTFKEKLLDQFRHGVQTLVPDLPANAAISQLYKAITPLREIVTLDDPENIYAHSLIFDASVN